MAVNNKAAPKPTNGPRSAVPSIPPLAPVDPTTNGKRKKKKKGKGRSEAYDEEDDEEMPPLESTTITGLSPELESAHLSANAALEKARASREELEATATELYSHFMDPPGHFGTGTDDYWNSLPTQTRDFVRDIHSQAALAGTTDTTSKAQTMYSMAQHVIQTGKIPTKVLPGSYPVSSIPFDPSVLSDPAIKLSLEAAFNTVAANGGFPSLNLSDPAYNDDGEYDSEEEGEDALEEMDGHVANRRNGANGTNPIGSSPASEPSKRNKKKKSKKKSNTTPIPTLAPPPPITTPAPPPRPAPVPTTTTAPTSAAPAQSTRPPQSSRAAGKQPMSYAPPPTNTRDGGPPPLIPPPATGTRPSARAASKQPLSNYGTGHHHQGTPPSSNSTTSGKHRQPAGVGISGSSNNPKNASKIWSTNSLEERERIKEFWLNLGEQERRDLVKVEKEAVLKKMKEQQKHSCSCAVCGRKRTAIEEELEVLYDAYYEDLEHYANMQQQHVAGGGPPPPGPGPFPGSVALDQNGAVIGVQGQQHPSNKHPPGRGKHQIPATNGVIRKGQQPRSVPPPPPQDDEEYDEEDGDEYDDDEEYDEEEEEEEGEDEDDGEEDESGKPGKRKGGDVFSFSNFTAAGPGNILTVADDLLKNDGQKFLEMMEQLAERRMMREEEAAASIEDNSDEDDQDEEDDEEDEEDEDDEEEDDPIMTEEQKMQEGKRMFSIFAARMFEQRVLQAYRERVAQERQLQLLRELEDEERAAAQKDAKKQSANQKKKDKKRQQKAVKDEEKLRRENERAEEEAATKARQEALEEAQRKKREEERLKREAERLRKEEEKMRLAEERRKRVAEEQRKAAEKAAVEQRRAAEKAAKEKDRKDREERERKAKEEAAREERERKAREEEARKEKEAREVAERKAAELAQQQKQAAAAKAALAAKTGPLSPPNAANLPQRATPAPKKILSKPQQVSSSPPSVPRPVAATAQPQTPAQSQPQTPAPAPAPATVPTTPATSPAARQPAPRPTIATTSPVPVLHQQPQPQPIPIPGPSQHLPAYAQQQQTQLAPPGIASPPVTFLPPSPHQAMPLNGVFPPHVAYNAGYQQSQGMGLGPSALPRGYPTPIETNFDGNMGFQKAGPPGLPPPIGPPKTFGAPPAIGSASALSSPVAPFPPRSESLPSVNGIGGHMRRGSLHEPVGRTNPLLPAFGAVQRPIAPISRPVGPTSSAHDAEEKVPSGSSSRRSPSPTFLGSKALLNEDDEPILPASGRRTGVSATPALSPGWGAPGEPHVLDPIGRGIGSSSSWGIPHSSNNLWNTAPFTHPQPPNVPFGHHPPFPMRPPAPSTPSSQGS